MIRNMNIPRHFLLLFGYKYTPGLQQWSGSIFLRFHSSADLMASMFELVQSCSNTAPGVFITLCSGFFPEQASLNWVQQRNRGGVGKHAQVHLQFWGHFCGELALMPLPAQTRSKVQRSRHRAALMASVGKSAHEQTVQNPTGQVRWMSYTLHPIYRNNQNNF